MAIREQLGKALRSLRWFPTYTGQRLIRRRPRSRPLHLVVTLADHFEPAIVPEHPRSYAPLHVQEARVATWCREYARAVDAWRDADGQPFRHTYFYPAEQYDAGLIAQLAEHCRAGWGEVEIHLHHGLDRPDSAANTRRLLSDFRDALAGHGCLARWEGRGAPRYAFVHGNWALANSARGRFCGVNEEMQILAETGCYADLTLPSAPSPAQVPKINALYECRLPLRQRAPHRRGRDLRRGRTPRTFPLIVQGPLQMRWAATPGGLPAVRIDNGAVAGTSPLTMARLRAWLDTPIVVRGRPDWIFLKLHCHGMDPRDADALRGRPLQRFLEELIAGAGDDYAVYFMTAREMVNAILAACEGRDGRPGDYRDFRLRLAASPGPRPAPRAGDPDGHPGERPPAHRRAPDQPGRAPWR
jgi:hypothetical protein